MTESLPIYSMQKLDTIVSQEGMPFDIMLGLDQALVEQVKKFSLDTSDTDLQANTSDFKRFGEGSYEEWYGKDRTPYALTDAMGQLAALAWFGPKPLGRKSLKYLSPEELAKENEQEKSDWHTIVYRSYEPYRGKGLMSPFMRYVIADYKKRFPEAKLWAGVHAANGASVGLAKKFGFVISDKHSDPEANWYAMIEA